MGTHPAWVAGRDESRPYGTGEKFLMPWIDAAPLAGVMKKLHHRDRGEIPDAVDGRRPARRA